MFGLFAKKKQVKVLLVDDEPSIVQTMRDRLELNQYQVFTAFDGQEGLQKAIELKPDIILLDTCMPVMNGHEMLERLRQNAEGRDMHVIMVTATSRIGDIDKADKFGVDDYIIKPFKMRELIEKIHNVLEQKNAPVII